jgi:PAS domain S-box-containing protein
MGESTAPISKADTQLYREVFHASPIGIAVETLDGQPLFVIPTFCSMLGFSEEEMRGNHCVNFSPPAATMGLCSVITTMSQTFTGLLIGCADHFAIRILPSR